MLDVVKATDVIAKPTLDFEVVRVLSETVTSDEAARVLAAALDEFRTLEADADALDVAALSPMMTMAEALQRRDAARDMRFKSDRLEASCSALRARLEDLREEEERTARKAEREAALQEQAELAAAIAEAYPEVVRTLTSLVKRIAASDARCQAIGINTSAEALGRNIDPSFHDGRGPIPRMASISLPMPSSHECAWAPEGDRIGAPLVWRGLDA